VNASLQAWSVRDVLSFTYGIGKLPILVIVFVFVERVKLKAESASLSSLARLSTNQFQFQLGPQTTLIETEKLYISKGLHAAELV